MNRWTKWVVAVSAAAMLLDASNLMAQNAGGGGGRQRNRDAQGDGGGNRGNRQNMDPAQMRERMMERYKETLGVSSDAEWKIIAERIQKVMEAQRETRAGGMGMMGNRRAGGPGGDQGGDTQGGGATAQRRGGTSNPAAAELQKALDENASSEVVATKLASLRDSRKAAEAKLEAAQAELQKIVTRKQEARLVLMGLLK